MQVDKKLEEFILTYLVSFISHGQTKVSTDAVLDKINSTYNVDMKLVDIAPVLDKLIIVDQYNDQTISFSGVKELVGNEDAPAENTDEVGKLADAGAEKAMEKI